MTPSLTLAPEHRAKLDGIVQQMTANNEPDENIQAVVEDFKHKYAGAPTAAAPPSWGQQFGNAFIEGWKNSIPNLLDPITGSPQHLLDTLGEIPGNIARTVGGVFSGNPEDIGGLVSQAPLAALPAAKLAEPAARVASATGKAVSRGIKGAIAEPPASYTSILGLGSLGELPALFGHTPYIGPALAGMRYAYPPVKGFFKGVIGKDIGPVGPIEETGFEPGLKGSPHLKYTPGETGGGMPSGLNTSKVPVKPVSEVPMAIKDWTASPFDTTTGQELQLIQPEGHFRTAPELIKPIGNKMTAEETARQEAYGNQVRGNKDAALLDYFKSKGITPEQIDPAKGMSQAEYDAHVRAAGFRPSTGRGYERTPAQQRTHMVNLMRGQ